MASKTTREPSPLLALGSHAFVIPHKTNYRHHVLGYHVCGNPSGSPVFYFHGSPSSRLQVEDFHNAAGKLNLCIIGVDRPGIGLSTFRPRYTLLDWPHDIRKLAAYLGFSEYRVLGASGGGPYALACALILPEEELKGTGVLAGIGPPESGSRGLSWDKRVGLALTRSLPWWSLHYAVEYSFGRHARNPDQTHWRKIVIGCLIKTMAARDQALVDTVETERFINDLRETFINGSQGYVLDAQMTLSPWPFDLKSVDGKVQLWNGSEDVDTPVQMARWMANQLPNGTLREFPGDTHVSIVLQRGEEVLTDLMKM